MSLCNVITLFPRGTEEYLNCKGRVDIINSTLGKALGGAAGSVNYLTCCKSLTVPELLHAVVFKPPNFFCHLDLSSGLFVWI